jgi:hypothetical protein
MIGEKFIGKKIEGNKIIRISEFKSFDNCYEDIAYEINDSITDEPEELYNNYGIIMGFDDFVGIDCDKCIDGINGFLDNCDADEKEEYDWLEGYLNTLKEAEGFIIYFDSKIEDYK